IVRRTTAHRRCPALPPLFERRTRVSAARSRPSPRSSDPVARRRAGLKPILPARRHDDLALSPRAARRGATNAAVVRRRLRLHQPLTLERAQEATDVTGIQLQSRAQIAHFRAGAPDFVEQPRFPEWTVAIEKMVLERADALTDRAIEAAHAAHLLRID